MAQPSRKDEANKLSLSAALLAPLNAIFEAQVHAARAFLNFILQMGFKHNVTEEDLEELAKDPGNQALVNELREQMNQRKNARRQIRNLKARLETEADEEERDRIKEQIKSLSSAAGGMHTQNVSYFDDNGAEKQITISNLSLIPIQPLAVSEADFSFEMEVDQRYEHYDQMKKENGAKPDRPWFLIKPRRINGTIGRKGSVTEKAGIEINIKVKNAPLPYGLGKLVSAMDEGTQITEKTEDETV